MKLKKINKTITYCISILVLLLSIIIIISVVYAKSVGKAPSIFGYSAHIVVSDSMKGELEVGDLLLAKKTAKQDIKIGDNIVFVSPDPTLNKKIIVHKVIDITTTSDDNILFTTSGIKEGASADDYLVENIIGKVKSSTSSLSYILIFLSNPRNLIFSIIMIILIIAIISAGVSTIKLAKKTSERKNEQSEKD